MVRWIIYLCTENVKLDTPLQAYFRINSENMGQFERTLIIADEGASVNYVEGCTAQFIQQAHYIRLLLRL